MMAVKHCLALSDWFLEGEPAKEDCKALSVLHPKNSNCTGVEDLNIY